MEMIYVHIYVRTTDIWLLQVRVINQEDLVMVIKLLLSLCCDYCLI